MRESAKGAVMYQDLRSKLEMYRNNRTNKSADIKKTGFEVQDIIDGAVCRNDDGTCFVIENRYPLAYLHGGYPFSGALNVNICSLKRICEDLTGDTNIYDFLFLDTETTGLSGGTGTVAFLVGTGFFEKDAFVLRQYFMRDYDEEPSMLRELNRLFAGYKVLVSFNGKVFDWNLLNTRFIFNRIKCELRSPFHIDLLFPSRRIWKLKLESCRLASLEENILGEFRTDDIPGELIPSVYFNYLETRDAGEIKRVIKHNETDVLSMVSLLTKIACMLDNPFDEAEGEYELLGLGRIFEKNGEYDTVVKCFEACSNSSITHVKEAASKRLSDIYKKSGSYVKAVEHWEKMLEKSEGFNIFPMIELAKYYEHREKNITRAMEVVEKAFCLSQQVGFRNNIFHRDLIKRLERLKRKAGRQ